VVKTLKKHAARQPKKTQKNSKKRAKNTSKTPQKRGVKKERKKDLKKHKNQTLVHAKPLPYFQNQKKCSNSGGRVFSLFAFFSLIFRHFGHSTAVLALKRALKKG